MSNEKKEKNILLISFGAGLFFAIAEFVFAIYSHSQSTLMDAAYDASELIFIVLILFLTPLFHKPISEKRPYGFFQAESIFLIIKGFMLLSVTFIVLANIIESALSGGNPVNGGEISLFQLSLGLISLAIYAVIKKLNEAVSSPTVKAELLGWKVDTAYSIGMSVAFFASILLDQTCLSFISPYFDQLMAVAIAIFMLPENIQMLWAAIKEVFLFSPDEDTVHEIKTLCQKILETNQFQPMFFDITKTGRHLWIAIYFVISEDCLSAQKLETASCSINEELGKYFEDCTCELIWTPKN